MPLSKPQKKLARRLFRSHSPEEIASHLGIAPAEVKTYLSRFPKDAKQAHKNGFIKIRSLEPSERRVILIQLLTIASLVLMVYANSLPNAFVSDDIAGFRDNKQLNQMAFLTDNPLVIFKATAYYLINRLFGMNPWAFRAFHILVHLITAVSSYFIAGLFIAPSAAFVAAAIIAVHPVFTESVVWVAGGGYALYSALFLMSLLFYLNSHDKKRYYPVSILFFILAITTSDKAFPLALIFPVYEFLTGNLKKNWRRIFPYFLTSGLWLFFYFTGFNGLQSRQEALETDFGISGFYNPVIQIPVAFSTYLIQTVFPATLSIFHSKLAFPLPEYLFRLGIFLIFATAGAMSYFKSKTSFFFLMAAVISLTPTLTPFLVGWVTAERYAYLAFVFFIMAITAALDQKFGSKLKKPAAVALFLTILIMLSTRTVIRNTDWQNENALWQATYKTAPNDPRVHTNVGEILLRKKAYQKAEEEFKTAISLNSGRPAPYYNLGVLYYETGNIAGAIEMLNKTISLSRKRPEPFQLLSTIYYDQGKFPEALQTASELETLDPENPVVFLNLGKIYLKLGEKQKAKEALEKTLQIDPGFVSAKKILEGL
jgi:Tfp pilus assembly protein PilF